MIQQPVPTRISADPNTGGQTMTLSKAIKQAKEESKAKGYCVLVYLNTSLKYQTTPYRAGLPQAVKDAGVYLTSGPDAE